MDITFSVDYLIIIFQKKHEWKINISIKLKSNFREEIVYLGYILCKKKYRTLNVLNLFNCDLYL